MEQSRRESLEEQCHELEDFVDLIIKKYLRWAKPCSEKNLRTAVVFPLSSSLIFTIKTLPQFTKAMVEEQRKVGKPPVVASMKIHASTFCHYFLPNPHVSPPVCS